MPDAQATPASAPSSSATAAASIDVFSFEFLPYTWPGARPLDTST